VQLNNNTQIIYKLENHLNQEIINKFMNLLDRANKIVGFTGAGISTDSGIPDYRSKGGIWERFKPVYIDEFLRSEEKRILYWKRKIELWADLKKAKSNSAHNFFVEIDKRKKLIGLITQNIDGLHQKAGLNSFLIIQLHGTNLQTICLQCNKIYPTEEIMALIDIENGAPHCSSCDGFLKPNTISFGQQLKHQDLERAEQLVKICDLLIIVGSTLSVQPASLFPQIAYQNGAKIVIVNLSDTPMDEYADIVVRENCTEFFNSIF